MASDWLQIPGNRHAYESLRTLVASGQAIAFVGAGASAGLYPLWPALIRQLADAAVQFDHRNEESRDYWLKTDPQDAVDQIKNSLGGTYRDKIREIFASRVGKDGNWYTAIHAALISLPFCGFVTTNFDTALHQARQKLRALPFAGPVTWKDEDVVRRWRRDQIFKETPCPILSAHGCWERGDTIVLGNQDYRETYATDPYADLFKHLWGASQLVFVGFGFNDPWLKFLAREAITRLGALQGAPQHYAISGLSELRAIVAQRQTFRNTYNADPLFYPVSIGPDGSEDHSALLAVLQALATETGAAPSGPGGGATKGGSRKPRKHIKPGAPQPKNMGQATPSIARMPPAERLERSSGWDINNAHKRTTETALRQTPELFGALWPYLQRFFPNSAIAQTETAVVEHFATVNSSNVSNCFFAVRRALREVRDNLPERHVIRRSEIAACYLYCLAAHRLVNNVEHDFYIGRLGLNRSVILVPDKTNILCAIIITALCGGKVHLLPDEDARVVEDRRLPRADYVFELAPDDFDRLSADLALQAYRAIMQGWRGETATSLDTGSGRSLSADEEKRLRVHIENIRKMEDANPAFIVERSKSSLLDVWASACNDFSGNSITCRSHSLTRKTP